MPVSKSLPTPLGRWSCGLIVAAGLFGAAGVGVAAYAAHKGGGETLMTAAVFLLLHATPMAAIALSTDRRGFLAAATILAAGVFLFSGDLCLRYIADLKPLPLAAPTGGLLLIAGWLGLAAAGMVSRRGRDLG